MDLTYKLISVDRGEKYTQLEELIKTIQDMNDKFNKATDSTKMSKTEISAINKYCTEIK